MSIQISVGFCWTTGQELCTRCYRMTMARFLLKGGVWMIRGSKQQNNAPVQSFIGNRPDSVS